MLAPRDITVAVFTTFMWALNVLFTKIALAYVSPLGFNFLRMLVVLPLVFVFPLKKNQWIKILPTALVWGVGHFAFIGLGMKAGAGVGMGGLLLQVSPILATIFAYFILDAIPSRYHIMAFVPICAGIFWGLYTASNFCICIGYFYLLVAAAFMGLGSVLLKIAMCEAEEPLSPTAAIVAFAPLTILVHFTLALFYDGLPSVTHQVSMLAEPWMLGLMVFGGWGSMVAGMRAWGTLVRKYSVADVAPFALLVPCFTMLFGYLTGERLTADNIIAAVLIFSGLLIGQLGRPVSQFVYEFARKKKNKEII